MQILLTLPFCLWKKILEQTLLSLRCTLKCPFHIPALVHNFNYLHSTRLWMQASIKKPFNNNYLSNSFSNYVTTFPEPIINTSQQNSRSLPNIISFALKYCQFYSNNQITGRGYIIRLSASREFIYSSCVVLGQVGSCDLFITTTTKLQVR